MCDEPVFAVKRGAVGNGNKTIHHFAGVKTARGIKSVSIVQRPLTLYLKRLFMGIQATQADSSLLSYARMNLPRGNCAETRDIPTVREPETVCQINVDNYIRSIFESLVDNFGEERALDMAFSGLRLSPPEKYGEYLCKFILQINCEPICEDVDDALLDADSQIQSFSREELISKLTTAVFFSTQYRQLTRSLHQLERAPGEFLVFDLPMRCLLYTSDAADEL